MPSNDFELRRTVRRVGAVVALLLAGLLYVAVHTADAYRIGRFYNALLGWTAVTTFWLGLAYLFVSLAVAPSDSTSSDSAVGDGDQSSS